MHKSQCLARGRRRVQLALMPCGLVVKESSGGGQGRRVGWGGWWVNRVCSWAAREGAAPERAWYDNTVTLPKASSYDCVVLETEMGIFSLVAHLLTVAGDISAQMSTFTA